MTKFSRGFNRGHIAAAKLTPTKVYEMRQLYSEGWTQRALADKYNMSVVQVGRICRGESWRQYYQPPHPDQIEDSKAKAILKDSPIELMPQESIERLMKDLVVIGEVAKEEVKEDPIAKFLKDKGEGK